MRQISPTAYEFMKWEIFQNLHKSLKEEEMDPKTKLRILYSTPQGRRNTVECTFKTMLQKLWELYEVEDFVAIAIFTIKGKQATAIFKHTIPTMHTLSNRPPTNGNHIVFNWNKKQKRAKALLSKMTAMKIEEELHELRTP